MAHFTFFSTTKSQEINQNIEAKPTKNVVQPRNLKVQPYFWQRLNHGYPTDDFKSKAFLRTYEQPCSFEQQAAFLQRN